MISTYNDAINWMLNRTKFGIVPGLQRMEEMLLRLDQPHHHIKAIHVAGTNGKGSTISYIQSILLEAGYKVGTFTSPYIIDYREQIMFCGEMIGKEDFIMLVNKMKPIVEEVEKLPCGAPTEFEILTTMAFYYFGQVQEHDIFLVEVGLGGLEDCTNVITPLISIITSIGHDHHQILGNSIEEITVQKAGIIKKGIPTITAELKEEALNIIQKMAIKNESTLFEFDKQFKAIDLYGQDHECFNFVSQQNKFEQIEISMIGQHQIRNASCAIMAIELLTDTYGFQVTEKELKSGLKKAYREGRLEKISTEPMILIDGAHNIEGIQSLVESIKSHFNQHDITIVFSALKDKDVIEMVELLQNITNNIIMTTFDFPRAMSHEELIHIAETLNVDYEINFKEAIEKNVKKIQKNGILLLTGSLYFISDVRKYLVNKHN
ncbi:folylpolyglutamate synthase/dihydrofolate synthase family protein [Bacillus sp. OAE603]|uniref:bifunctional folylpolyglutamate synthase/dihydrofolate synthase n=1 Tax=Gottfriedia sp. OAE603 TaxID=2663872 RepID=UPI00178AA2F4